ncbi:MAG: 23S rRNA (uracil(1939)-C(5))-methyltransferase RlmD [Acidobacteria bacterium]|uniref:23S rRNA (Uracil(1939)-C(5))-methyltransferase RlmD n=1 Tax=Candidatus Polarisedimenticola svalbardensis TaxID=2886004 RepID=A0A8J7CDJ3_9BACT|nr:23S rRNA (uracil(1939)-C(5))-methyltransferase RlmD [Candidatus Polarisedimenticola svalbardensis]
MSENPNLVELDITALAAGGRGVARREGKVWMVEGAVPGDRVLATAVRERPRLAEGHTVRILDQSAQRREPVCGVQGDCGGCPWMVLPEQDQRDWKRRVVLDSLERIAGLTDPPVEPVKPSPLDLAYRGKAEFSTGTDETGTVLVGFRHNRQPELLVDVAECPVIPETANRVLKEVRLMLGAPEEGGTVGLAGTRGRRLVLRQSAHDGGVLVIFRGQGREWAGPRRDMEKLAKTPGVVGVVALTGLPGRRGGVRSRLLAGRDHLVEALGGTLFKVPAATFFQVNPAAAAILVDQVVEMAGPVANGDPVLDLYGGVGVFGWALAAKGARVTVCEADPHAVAVGREGVGSPHHPTFACDDVGRFLGRGGPSQRPRLVVANPPRTGFGKGVAGKIAGLGSERVIMVSCDPGTLARDLKPLLAAGYRMIRLVPVDLFPQTAHVETVTLLQRG